MENPSEQSELTLQITHDQLDLISTAADILGITTEDLVIRAAIQRSLIVFKTYEQATKSELTPAEKKRFDDLLKNPPKATEGLRILMSLTPIPER